MKKIIIRQELLSIKESMAHSGKTISPNSESYSSI